MSHQETIKLRANHMQSNQDKNIAIQDKKLKNLESDIDYLIKFLFSKFRTDKPEENYQMEHLYHPFPVLCLFLRCHIILSIEFH